MANELFAAFEADELLVEADPTLTEAERGRIITRLTNELVEAERERILTQLNDERTEEERAAGLEWRPLFSFSVEGATENGSKTIDLRNEAQ